MTDVYENKCEKSKDKRWKLRLFCEQTGRQSNGGMVSPELQQDIFGVFRSFRK